MTTRTRRFKGKEIPSATTTQIHICGDPNCGHVHLVGFDDEGQAFCELVVGREICEKALSALRGH